MNKAIATGTIVDTDTVTIAATVYVDLTDAGAESAAAGAHYVTLTCKKHAVAAMPTAPLAFADVVSASGAETLTVPGLMGHANVTLATPTAMKYAKTKAFVKDGKAEVYTALRFNY